MLAYYDSFSGLVPVRIVRAYSELGMGGDRDQVECVITGDRGPYKKGERHTFNLSFVVPRTAVRFRKHDSVICGYAWSIEFKR